jgi:hypothetical protein
MFTALCHCSHCQKQSGSAFSIVLGVPADALTIEGTPGNYADQSEAGLPVNREFCTTCGSPLFTIGEGAPGVVFIKGGTLDDTGALQPRMELWTQSAQPWLKLDVPLKSFPQQPMQ